jgi:hypothetical protein
LTDYFVTFAKRDIMMKKITPKRYIQFFCIVVILLSIAREIRPSLAHSAETAAAADSVSIADTTTAMVQNSVSDTLSVPFKPHKIYSVSSFDGCFPDQNDVQLVSAQRNGVAIVKDRDEAERRKGELVYVGGNPYFFVEEAKSSIPYLVPSAAVLLQDIGSVFFDSLQIKGIPLHKIIVTSVLRTQKDVEELRKHNFNAKQNSCHQYATTFDICYNRYKTVQDPDGVKRRAVTNDTLKWVLSEVLDDFRNQNRCYIKYEKKQGCFHITVR